jgi:hypothetical protein
MKKIAATAAPANWTGATEEPKRKRRTAQPAMARFPGPLKEGIISAAIYLVIATPVALGLTLYRLGGWVPFREYIGIPETLGRISAQFTLLAILLSVLAYLRRRSSTQKFVLLDWRWWMFALVLLFHPTKPIVSWLGVGLVYQYRESRRRAVQISVVPR